MILLTAAQQGGKMDLLDEYNNKIMDEFIEGRLDGEPVWFKTTETGNVVLFSPNKRPYYGGGLTGMKIEVLGVGAALEFVGYIKYNGYNMYEIDIIQAKEVEDE
jgi:hypothetical protein